jgi:hypothetical protein
LAITKDVDILRNLLNLEKPETEYPQILEKTLEPLQKDFAIKLTSGKVLERLAKIDGSIVDLLSTLLEEGFGQE